MMEQRKALANFERKQWQKNVIKAALIGFAAGFIAGIVATIASFEIAGF